MDHRCRRSHVSRVSYRRPAALLHVGSFLIRHAPADAIGGQIDFGAARQRTSSRRVSLLADATIDEAGFTTTVFTRNRCPSAVTSKA
jgi:hypothetical protein